MTLTADSPIKDFLKAQQQCDSDASLVDLVKKTLSSLVENSVLSAQPFSIDRQTSVFNPEIGNFTGISYTAPLLQSFSITIGIKIIDEEMEAFVKLWRYIPILARYEVLNEAWVRTPDPEEPLHQYFARLSEAAHHLIAEQKNLHPSLKELLNSHAAIWQANHNKWQAEHLAIPENAPSL